MMGETKSGAQRACPLRPRCIRAVGPWIHVSIYLSIYLSVCLSVCLSIYLSKRFLDLLITCTITLIWMSEWLIKSYLGATSTTVTRLCFLYEAKATTQHKNLLCETRPKIEHQEKYNTVKLHQHCNESNCINRFWKWHRMFFCDVQAKAEHTSTEHKTQHHVTRWQ
jgi:hypothetical protein